MCCPGRPTRGFDGYDDSLAWLRAEHHNLVTAVGVAAQHGFDDYAWQIPTTMWELLNLGGYWDDWIDTHHIALAAARRAALPATAVIRRGVNPGMAIPDHSCGSRVRQYGSQVARRSHSGQLGDDRHLIRPPEDHATRPRGEPRRLSGRDHLQGPPTAVSPAAHAVVPVDQAVRCSCYRNRCGVRGTHPRQTGRGPAHRDRHSGWPTHQRPRYALIGTGSVRSQPPQCQGSPVRLPPALPTSQVRASAAACSSAGWRADSSVRRPAMMLNAGRRDARPGVPPPTPSAAGRCPRCSRRRSVPSGRTLPTIFSRSSRTASRTRPNQR